MLNLKRFPGFFFRHKNYFALSFVLILTLFYLVHRWGLICLNHEIKGEIDKLCQLYKKGEAVGNLCYPLCIQKQIHSISCLSQHSKKQFVFTAKWNKRLIVIKSSVVKDATLPSQEEQFLPSPKPGFSRKRKMLAKEKLSKILSGRSKKHTKKANSAIENSIEFHFERKIRKLVVERLNMTLTRAELENLKHLQMKNKNVYEEDSEQRRVERENVFSLLQSQEYLLSKLFSERQVFPRILGTCGKFYGVEHLNRPTFSSMFALDEKAEWSDRMKLAVAIMDFVEEIETNFPDALHLCDIQMNHLGVTNSGRIKFLDLDFAYLKNTVDKIMKSGKKCEQHKDCDLLDCKSKCNLKEKVCDSGVVNDNLQGICEKIFIGWTMSGKVLVPGLLMSEYTPASLSALLRVCAENRRQPVQEDLRQRLYTTLTEMHQILVQKILPD